MATEIERKFLVTNDDWAEQPCSSSSYVVQGYLTTTPAIRVRVTGEGEATLTIKSSEPGMSRAEFEYEIPRDDAYELLEMAGSNIVQKLRHKFQRGDVVWEIDEFLEGNTGLVVAEVELPSEDHELDTSMSWLGEEVTNDPRYYNAHLAQLPFCEWDD